jgi:CubicO group peptidase (beta-lactamase class C family)
MHVERQAYFPPPESAGGWRVLEDSALIRSQGRIDPERLALAWEYNVHSRPKIKTPEEQALNPHDTRIIPEARSSAVLILRHGYIVGEWYQNSDRTTRWDICSCTKSITGTAFGMLFEDSRKRLLPGDRTIDLDSPAYRFIPEGHPLTDARKERITVRHLLTMTSCIKGEGAGIFGVTTAAGVGPFEMALGHGLAANGASASQLLGEPGSQWDYSDPAFAHLTLVFSAAAGMELGAYLQDRVFGPIDLQNYTWDQFGGDAGHIGPHTIPNSNLKTNARDLARFGYLNLTNGLWEGRQIVPRAWIELATRTSQSLNRDYGYTWWVNTAGSLWPGVPTDAFAAMGYLGNKCYVIPSLDLVIVRIGDGPWPWDDTPFLNLILESVL